MQVMIFGFFQNTAVMLPNFLENKKEYVLLLCLLFACFGYIDESHVDHVRCILLFHDLVSVSS